MSFATTMRPTPDLATDGQPPKFTRRQILAGLAGAGAVTAIGTTGLAGAMRAFAVAGAEENAVLVNVFLRGGADGLNVVVPHGDDDYYRIRPSIARQPDAVRDLDGFFGFNEAFAALDGLYRQGELAVVHAAGSPDPTRSHFSAMDNMDLAFGVNGWMERVLATETGHDALSGFSIGSRSSPSLRGPSGGMAIDNLRRFKQTVNRLAPVQPSLQSMYAAADPLLGTATLDAFASAGTLLGVDPNPDVTYPPGGFARDLREAAALIKADIGVRMVAVNHGGWDHHTAEVISMEGTGRALSESLAAFRADLGTHGTRVLVVVMTEFGRTAEENGGGGTDHGHGSLMMLLGGALASTGGGRVHVRDDQWVGLSEAQLDRGRYLAVTTDFRDVLGEVLDRHLGFTDFGPVFGSYSPSYLGVLAESGAPPSTTTTSMATTTTVGPPTTPGPTTTSTTGPPPPTALGSIAGTVTFTGGAPAAGIAVDRFRSAGSDRRGDFLGSTRTDGAGAYAFADVEPGDYILTFIAPPTGRFVGGRRWAQPGVTVQPGQHVTGVNAELVSGGSVDGTLEGVVTTSDGAPVGDVQVDVFVAAADGSRSTFLGNTRTGADGTFAAQVQPGCYVLVLIAPAERRFVSNGRIVVGGRFLEHRSCVDANGRATGNDGVLA